jgi:hypothetical protein
MENKLPESQLIEILKRKGSERSDVVFDYTAKLEELRLRVGGEVRFINELFPEYTPHDEEYHLSRLFHVADTLIGPDRYESMNATELFVLACGLYGHDWGMAVSAVERDYIITGVLPDGFSHSDFALLRDEHKGFERFIKERGLEIDDIRTNGIENQDWREYVRKTHAFKSGERIRHYFQNIDSGIGDAAGRVCEGHWLNIEDIQDFHRYPTNFAVLRENLNLAALAIYVRLVDLLDIGHDRTPYVIWKFVAPRDSYSKMEWKKHRVLQPITCPTYLNGRVVLVDGSTDDHEVYAALEDLRGYCEKQLRECMDLLAQLGDSRHLMDLYHVEWRVVPRGFDPVLVRFEFDRERVFEILSSEIYQGDPYVFLRELLQNSIDAIRMRRELLEHRGGVKLEGFGLIDVKVEQNDNGDAKITWTDDGIGMDAYVVRNYLAVAGRSYYRSEDFERQGLKLDPISKFGIGILSCFMVANLVEIETCKDPYATSFVGALKIRIPSMTRQFRIERAPLPDFGIGTRVSVYVEGRLLEDGASIDVTAYLKQIAGFVEFPIVISETTENTLILHPKSTIDPTTDRRLTPYPRLNVHRIALNYPISEAILPQDLDNARKRLVERAFDLTDDLNVSSCEGCITYLELGDKNDWVQRNFEFIQGEGVFLSDGNPEEKVQIRWQREWGDFYSQHESSISRSASTARSYSVYRDGVLVPNATLPSEYLENRRNGAMILPLPRLVVNLVNTDSTQLDLARVELRSHGQHWFQSIDRTLTTKLCQELAIEVRDLTPEGALSRVGLLGTTYDVGEDPILTSIGTELPVVTFAENGTLEIMRWHDWAGKTVRLYPEILEKELRVLLRAKALGKSYEGYLRKWRGVETLITHLDYYDDLRIDYCIDLANKALHRFYMLDRAELLRPPGNELPPLVQEIWEPRDGGTIRALDSIAAQAIDAPLTLTADECARLLKEGGLVWAHKVLAIPVQGAPPFRIGDIYNLSHPVVDVLFRSLAWIFLNKTAKALEVNIGRMKDAIYPLLPYEIDVRDSEILTTAATELFTIASSVGIRVDSPVTTKIRKGDLWYSSPQEFDKLARKHTGTFGEPLQPDLQ